MSNGKHCLDYCKDVEKYGLKAFPIQNECVLIKAKESTIQSRLHLGFSQCSYKQICTKYGLGEAEELKEKIWEMPCFIIAQHTYNKESCPYI